MCPQKKELAQENTLSTKKASKKTIKKKRKTFFFSWTLSWSGACFLEQVLLFMDECVFSWTSACFLVFLLSFFSFTNSQPRVGASILFLWVLNFIFDKVLSELTAILDKHAS